MYLVNKSLKYVTIITYFNKKANIYSENLFDFMLTSECVFDIIQTEQAFGFYERVGYPVMINSKTSRVQLRKREEIKRKRRFNRRMVKLSVVVTVCFLLSLMFGLVSSYAGSKAEAKPVTHKYFTSTYISADRGIDAIAAEYGLTSYSEIESFKKEVRSINHIADLDSISAGTHIIVPYTK